MSEPFVCSVCGHVGEFAEEGVGARDDFRCSRCRSMVRQRDVAQLILDEFGRGAALSIDQAIAAGSLNEVDIYEAGMQGPLHARLRALPRYLNSYFWDDVELGLERDGVRCEDLTKLTFPDLSFDLVVSLEVLEHVFDIEQAVSEIARVLRVGGVHIFSIPVRYPFPAQTKVLASRKDNGEIEYLAPPRYHVAGDQSKSLVVSDFGQDFINLHADHGLRLTVPRRSAPMARAAQNASFVARKVGAR